MSLFRAAASETLVHQDSPHVVLLRLQEAVHREGRNHHGGLAAWTRQVDDGFLDAGELQERH